MLALLKLFYAALGFQLCLAVSVSTVRRNNPSAPAGFVTAQGESFALNGSPFPFYGTNAYWLPMATDDDINIVFHDIATAGFQVVRVWAFNDVAHVPASGAYFQVLSNGQATINTGSNGLQRLDLVVATAAKYGVKLLLTLTNNWNPARTESDASFSRRDDGACLPRGYLSNDYGGIDLYVNTFCPGGTHDQFYTNSAIIGAFKNYLAAVIPRYANSSTVLGWELGNDIRCASTLPASSSCNPETITKWVAEISSYVKTLDPYHLVTAGDGGFYCIGCPKLYATHAQSKTQSSPTGPSFDGSYGVDTEDIISVPTIDFGSFQYFPDQVQYFTQTASDFAITAISQGGAWIGDHSATVALLGKPSALTAFAIVTKDHFPTFIPFNQVCPMPPNSPCGGVDDFQQNYAFVSWAQLVLNGNVGGALEYQWLQSGLTSQGTTHSKRGSLTSSPGDGSQHYTTPYTNQTVQQFLSS